MRAYVLVCVCVCGDPPLDWVETSFLHGSSLVYVCNPPLFPFARIGMANSNRLVVAASFPLLPVALALDVERPPRSRPVRMTVRISASTRIILTHEPR